MKQRTIVSSIILAMGILALVVGVLHFVMMTPLEVLIKRWVQQGEVEYIVATFKINHIGSGIFLLLIGSFLSLFISPALRSGKRWAARASLLTGIAFGILFVGLWVIVPEQFVQSVAFQFALFSLLAISLIILLPLATFWKHFNEPN